MSANDSSAAQQPMQTSEKSKGKQAEQYESGDMEMDDEESSGEESGPEEIQDADEDNLQEIDPANIVGRRTRGKVIDWQEAEQKSKDAGDEDEDDDEEYDEDFVDPDDNVVDPDDEMRD